MTYTEALQRLHLTEAQLQADFKGIKSRIRKQLVQYHPDNPNTGDSSKFIALHEAYEVLFMRKTAPRYTAPADLTSQVSRKPKRTVMVEWQDLDSYILDSDTEATVILPLVFSNSSGISIKREIKFRISPTIKTYYLNIPVPNKAEYVEIAHNSVIPIKYDTPHKYNLKRLTVILEFVKNTS